MARKKKGECCICKKRVLEKDLINCPFCGTLYWNKPKAERDLFIVQDLYLQNRSQKHFNRMGELLYPYARNIIIRKLKTTGKILSEEELEDLTGDTVLKLIEYYTTKEDFKIDSSFNGYIQYIILNPLYNDKKQDREKREISMSSKIKSSNGNKNIELEDMLSESMETYLFSEEWIMNQCQRDIQIEKILNLLDLIFLSSCRYDGIHDANKLMGILCDGLENKSLDHFNELWTTYGNYNLKNISDKAYSSIHDFVVKEQVKANAVVDEETFVSMSKGRI